MSYFGISGLYIFTICVMPFIVFRVNYIVFDTINEASYKEDYIFPLASIVIIPGLTEIKPVIAS